MTCKPFHIYKSDIGAASSIQGYLPEFTGSDPGSVAERCASIPPGNQTSWHTPDKSPQKHTPPGTNIYPENRPLEEEIPIGNHHFQGLC